MIKRSIGRHLGGMALLLMLGGAAAAQMPAKTPTGKKPTAVGLQSFAAVQAPEAATESCYAATAKGALDCAMRRCTQKLGGGAKGNQACYAVTLCAPGRWAGIMGVRVGEVSFNDVVCGAPTEAALISALKIYCEGHMPQLSECSLTLVWQPDGTAAKRDYAWSAADFKK
jgi:hypothetical protein